MKRLKAIASKMIQEAITLRVLLVVFLFLIVIVPVFPFILKSDGTLKGQMQLVLNYSIALTSIMIYLLSLYLGISSFTGELEKKHFYLIDSKPVERWQFIWGKFIGLALINLFIIIFMGSIILCMLLFTKHYMGTPEEREQINSEIFTAYRGVEPYMAPGIIAGMIEKNYQHLKKTFPRNKSEKDIKKELRKRILQRLRIIPYGYKRKWVFRNIPFYMAQSKKPLKLRYKFLASEASYGFLCEVRWIIGIGAQQFIFDDKVKPGEFLEFAIPSEVIQENSSVEVSFINKDPKAGMIFFPINKGVELFYHASNFYFNYIKSWFLIYAISCFLIMVGLFTATFLSFSVALFLALFILLLGFTAAIFQHTVFLKIFFQIIFSFSPSITKYAPLQFLSLGRIIEWNLIYDCIGKVLILRLGLLATLACFIFNRREVGKPIN